MKYYPINLNVSGKQTLVVGGGPVGIRKAQTLLDCGAFVTIVSPDFCKEVEGLTPKKHVCLKKRAFTDVDIENIFLVIGATDDIDLNWRISQLAHEKQMLCNIADFPEACNFILPSILRQGDFTVTISTSGKSPAFSKEMRKKLALQFGPEYGQFLLLMGAIREKLLAQAHAPEEHKPLFTQLIQKGLLEKIASQNIEEIDALLRHILGKDFFLSNLCPDIYALFTEKEEKP